MDVYLYTEPTHFQLAVMWARYIISNWFPFVSATYMLNWIEDKGE